MLKLIFTSESHFYMTLIKSFLCPDPIIIIIIIIINIIIYKGRQ